MSDIGSEQRTQDYGTCDRCGQSFGRDTTTITTGKVHYPECPTDRQDDGILHDRDKVFAASEKAAARDQVEFLEGKLEGYVIAAEGGYRDGYTDGADARQAQIVAWLHFLDPTGSNTNKWMADAIEGNWSGLAPFDPEDGDHA